MDEDFYEPPCRALLRERVACEGCGKELTRHCLLYRHACVPTEERRATYELAVEEAAQVRAAVRQVPVQTMVRQAPVQTMALRHDKYAHLVKW